MTVDRQGHLLESELTNIVPKERYISREFFDLEMEKLWPRVWQMACREEEVPAVGDYLEYLVGDQSILIVRSAPTIIKAYYNCCRHRGTRLADGTGNFATSEIRCRYHAWRWALDGRNIEVVDQPDFPPMRDDDVALAEVQVGRWGGFVFINMDPDAEPLLDFLDPLPQRLAPYELERLRFRSYRTTIIPANWKMVLDAFNESYHVQGTHPQLLMWTDDTEITYDQFGKHAHMQRVRRRNDVHPSPRLGLQDGDWDERELLASMVGELRGLFLKEELDAVEALRHEPLPPGRTALDIYNEIRVRMLERRGVDISRFTEQQLLNADDCYFFPNVVGPIYPGSTTLFRVRPNGLDPLSTIKDLWTLELPPPGDAPAMPPRKFYPDWSAKDWGLVTNQDYGNMEHVVAGMRSRGCKGLQLNPRQESNVLHMHRVIDRYLTS
ncbi:MAG TPA: aromatic ring-hydroxylating dioxygenase subunit alpha [Acidimicrobiales bacterium]|nr:aromatic ring-hydroxylating dioxygenase subunit alpha [Acidimicrobiales bacterium]